MKQSTRIVLNCLVLYAQLLITIAIGFLTTRLLLKQIGFVDYGILTALGASGIVSAIVVAGLAGAARRHLAYEVGRKEGERLREVYSSTLGVFAALGLALLILGAALKPLVFSLLNSPPDRVGPAAIVYWAIVAQWGLSTAVAPCKALMQAHQHMVPYAIFELFSKGANLAVVIALSFLKGDALVVFVLLTLVARVMETGILVPYSLARYPEARPRVRCVSRADSRRVLAFAGWSLLSMLTYQLRQQGSVFMTNVYFGPVVNAAYALGNTINHHVHLASQAVQNAVQPAMISVFAKEDRKYFRQLISAGSRYTWFASLFFFVPIILEAPYFLKLWLGEYPAGAPAFARLTTTASVVAYAINGHALALGSQDRMGPLVRVSASLQVAAFVLGVVAIPVFGLEAWALPVFTIAGTFSMWFALPMLFGKSLDFPVPLWLRAVVVPGLVVTAMGFGCGMAPWLLLEEGLLRLCAVIASAGAGLLAGIVLFGSTDVERRVLRRLAGRALLRLRKGGHTATVMK